MNYLKNKITKRIVIFFVILTMVLWLIPTNLIFGQDEGSDSSGSGVESPIVEETSPPAATEVTTAADQTTETTPATYTVTYDGNGGTGTVPEDSSSYVSGTTVTILGADSLLSTGNVFSGWNTGAYGSGTSYASGATFNIAENTTLYAQWTPDTTEVAKPVLTIELILPSATIDAGTTFKYKLRLTNNGIDEATDVSLKTHIPENVTYISNTTNGKFDEDTNNITWNFAKFVADDSLETEIEVGVSTVIASDELKTITASVECAEIATPGSIKTEFTVKSLEVAIDNSNSSGTDADGSVTQDGSNGSNSSETSVSTDTATTTDEDAVTTDNAAVTTDATNVSETTTEESINSTDTTTAATEEQVKIGSITIHEIDSATSPAKDLEGAVFEIYLGSSATGTPLQTKTTAADGLVKFDNLEFGTYTVKEVLAATGYTVLMPDATFDLSETNANRVYVADVAAQNGIVEEIATEEATLNPLTITMTDNPDPVGAGQSVTYTINYSNSGQTPLTGVVLTDFLPAGSIFVSASGGSEVASETVVWQIGNLEPGESGSLEVTVHIPQSSAEGSIYTNTAVIDSNETAALSVIEDTLDPVPYGSQMFYVFGWAPDVLDLLSSGSAPSYIAEEESGIYSILSISNGASGDVTAYLHSYSDPGDFNATTPSTSQNFWALPGYDSTKQGIIIHPGQVLTIRDLIYSTYGDTVNPGNPNTWDLAGGDLLFILGGPINVVRGFAPVSIKSSEGGGSGNVLAEFFNLYPTNMWDKAYTVPVGVDTYENTQNSGTKSAFSVNFSSFNSSNPQLRTSTAPTSFSPSGYVIIDSEIIKYSSLDISGSTVGFNSISRGQFGTEQITHSSGTPIYQFTSTPKGDGKDMEYTDLMVQAMEDNTKVTIVNNGVTTIKFLNEGQSWILKADQYSNVYQNATISSDQPVQAGLLTSNGGRVDTRNYNLTADELLGSDYFIPVVTGTGDRLYIYAFADNTEVKIEDGATTTIIKLNAGQVDSSYTISSSSIRALHITSYLVGNTTIKKTIQILGAADSNDSDKDWGFQAIDSKYYSSSYVTPYAPGDDTGTSLHASWNPLYVTPTSNNAIIFVDWDGNGFADRPNSSAAANFITLDMYGIGKLWDVLENDGDNGGAHIWALEYSQTQYNNRTLNSNISDTATTIRANGSISSYGSPGYIKIDNEIIKYSGITTTDPYQFTGCDRHQLGTAASDHNSGRAIYQFVGGTGNWAIDKDNSDIKIITVYYGEASGADSSTGYDWGYALVPLSPEFVSKILIVKKASSNYVHAGDSVTYTYTVQNTGDYPISGITVKDDHGTPGDPGDDFYVTLGTPSLAIGASTSGTSDPIEINENTTNTAVASGISNGSTITSTAIETVIVFNPGITLTKTADPTVIYSGGLVTYTYSVKNTGDDPLTGVTVVDGVTITVGDLAVGETRTGTLYTANPTADITNTATATGTDSKGGTVTDTDTADVNVITPGITLTKTADPTVIYSGGLVTYTYSVKNTGDDPLTGVTVVDGVTITVGDLAVGETRTGTLYTANPTADITNTATATGTDSKGGTVTDTDTADVNVITPGITLTKTADPTVIYSGGLVTYTYSVKNTGDDPLTGVTVVDGVTITVGDLAVGETRTGTLYTANPTADITNTATATGTDSKGGTVTDTDTADVNVINPGITLTKTADPTVIYSGGLVTYTYSVKNTGDDPLTGVTVVDGVTITVGDLAVGETRTGTLYTANPTADITNTATATGTDSKGGTVTDTDTADVNVINPGITLTKTADPTVIYSGGLVTYTYSVKNTGDDPLTGVTVVDGVTITVGDLAVGETRTGTLYTANPTADITNTATATGTDSKGGTVTDTDTADVNVITPGITLTKTADPTVIYSGGLVTYTYSVKNTGDDPLTGVTVVDGVTITVGDLAVGETRTGTLYTANPTADITNTATATGTDSKGGTVTDTDTADVNVITPGITLTKTADPTVIYSGGLVTYTYSVKNTGDDPLTGVTVVDGVTITVGDLAVGETRTGTLYTANPTADITNTATATGTDSKGGTVTDTDTADVNVITPGITLTKTADPTVIYSGGLVTYTYSVKNTGDDPLTGVTVVDGVTITVGDLAVGETRTGTLYTANPTADITNTATATGTDSKGGTVTDTDTADVNVINPGITLTKTADPTVIYSGGLVTYTYSVKNTGDDPLTGVTVVDGVTITVGDLAVGETRTGTLYTANPTADITNTATATGTDSKGGTVTDTDTADVNVINPGITLTKTADPTVIYSGGLVTYTYSVKNTGDDPLTGVTVVDGVTITVGDLAVGETRTGTLYTANPTADITNTATATGTDSKGGTVTDTDTADVNVITPGITLTKTADPTVIYSGGLVTYTYSVKNTGDDPLTGVTVVDGVTITVGDLAVGETRTGTLYTANPTADITNTATATGTDSKGGTVTDTDTADVNVITPGITLTKTADPTVIYSGGLVTYTYSVKNTGDDPLTGVTVVDGVTITVGDLAVGETRTGTLYTANPTADITNTATATGTDSKGGTVTDTDTADVNVITPGITLTKTADPTVIYSGGLVTYTYSVKNTGDDPLTGVTVVDGVTITVGDLAVGETRTGTLYTANPTADITNTATATGTDSKGGTVTDTDTADVNVINPGITLTKTADPTVIYSGGLVTYTYSVKNTGDDPLTGVAVVDGVTITVGDLAVGETRTGTLYTANPTADITNTATATGTDSKGGTVTDTDTADVNVITPGITLTKTADPTVIYSGGLVTYTYSVKNTGDDPLTGVTVVDGVTITVGDLAVGETRTGTLYTANPTADITNTATATGTDSKGGTVTDTDTADVNVITPGITLTKTADPTVIYSGGLVTYTYSVKNTGDDPLTGVTVVDGVTITVGDLAVGETRTGTLYTANPTADITNTATATGTDSKGGTVTDTDTADVNVITPGITLTKTADPTVIYSGGLVTYTYSVKNTGDDPLTGVTVVDGVTITVGDLAVGETRTGTLYTANPTADITNTATATGTDSKGGTVTDTDTADVNVITPGITLTKTADPTVIYSGGLVTYTYSVKNTGDDPLTGVTVVDGVTITVGDLAVGETRTGTLYTANPTADITNTATATGTDGKGGTVTDTDTADVNVITPGITLTKTADPTVIYSGGLVTYTYSVLKITGDDPLTGVTVVDGVTIAALMLLLAKQGQALLLCRQSNCSGRNKHCNSNRYR